LGRGQFRRHSPSAPAPLHQRDGGKWEALFLHRNSAFDPAGYTNLSFWINGGSSGGQLLQVRGPGGDAVDDGVQIAALSSTPGIRSTPPCPASSRPAVAD